MLLVSLWSPIHCIEEPLITYTHHEDSYTALYRANQFAFGARFEVFHYLVHWMLHRPEFREQALLLYRRELPNLLAACQVPNLSHLPLILLNAWKRFWRLGPAGSLRMLADSIRDARRTRHE